MTTCIVLVAVCWRCKWS